MLLTGCKIVAEKSCAFWEACYIGSRLGKGQPGPKPEEREKDMQTPEQIERYKNDMRYWGGRAYETWVGEGYMHPTNGNGSASIYRKFPTLTDATVAAAQLPKSLKARAYFVTGTDIDQKPTSYGYICIEADLRATGCTGDRNEAGIKRLTLAAKRLKPVWNPTCCLNAMTEEQFQSIVAGKAVVA